MNEKILNIVYFLILTIPIFFSVSWHYNNTQLPVSDAIGWLEAASNILLPIWENGKIASSVYELFSERPWRPIIFHLFVTPFLFLTNGNYILTTLITHSVFVALSTYIIYKFLRLKFDKFSSSISTVIICLSTNIMFGGIGLPLFAELSFTPFYLCTIYFLITSDFFKNKKNSIYFSLFFFLLFATRPVEALIYIVLPLIFFFYKGIKLNILSLYDVLKSLLISFAALSLLCLSRIIEFSSRIKNLDPPFSSEIYLIFSYAVFIFYLILLIIFLFSKNDDRSKTPRKNYLVLSFYIQTILIFIWWYPFFSNLFEWVYMTSFGAVVSYYKGETVLWLIPWAFKSSGIYIILIFSSTALLYMLISKFKNKFFNSDFYFQTQLLLLSIPIPWLVYLLSVQGFYRKVSLSMVCLVICLFYYILSKKKLILFSKFLISVVLIVQIYSISTHTWINFENDKFWSTTHRNKIASNMIGIEYPLPININPNPHDVVIDFLDKSYNKYKLKNFAITVDESGEPVDAFLISLMSKKYDFNATIPWITSVEFLNDDFKAFDQFDSFLLINPKNLQMNYTKENITNSFKLALSEYKGASARFAFYMQYLYSSKKLNEKGFKILECFVINIKHKGCLIIKIK